MKKIFSLLFLAALPLLMLTSCSSEDDLPEVDLTVNYSGATDVDKVLYVVQGDELAIDAINVTPLEGTAKATLGAVSYYWNFQFVGTVIVEPFGMAFDTASMPEGSYALQINSTVYQEGKSVGMAYMTYNVKIVASADDVPGGVTGSGVDDPLVDVRAGALPTR